MQTLPLALLAALATFATQAAGAQALPPPGATVQIIAPVFHERVLFSLPGTFQVTAPEHVSGRDYNHEIPLRGETVDRWTQLVTLTGADSLALKPNATAANVGSVLARKYGGSCPASFASEPAQQVHISGKPATLLLVSCGTLSNNPAQPGVAYSETALILVIQGTIDIYTLQWAQRGPAHPAPTPINTALWLGRLKTLQPVKVCPLAGGDAACLKQ